MSTNPAYRNDGTPLEPSPITTGLERWKGLVEKERAKRTVDREMHAVALIATDGVSQNVPKQHHDWAYDLRRGRLNLVGGILRTIDLLAARRIPKRIAMMIPEWIAYYVEDAYSDTPTPDAETVVEAPRVSGRVRTWRTGRAA